MSESPRVLVGADGSEQSDDAIRQADAWAGARGQLLVCHVAPRPLGANTFFPQLIEQVAMAEPELERRLEQRLRSRVARLTGREPAQVFVDTGDPASELVRRAQKQRATMVVVGNYGHRPSLLGNVAEAVVRHAPCSVLVARPHTPTGRILVGTDLSTAARSAVERAAEHAASAGARLTAACCIERSMEQVRQLTNFGTSYGFVEHEFQDLRRASRERLEAQLESVGAHGDTAVLEGDPAAALLEAATQLGADLLVLGARDTFGLERRELGRIAKKLLRAAPCSVLVVRASDGRFGST